MTSGRSSSSHTVSGGLAGERTALAWTRSAFAIVAVAASVGKAGEQTGQVVLAGVAAATLLALAALVWSAGHREHARRAGDESAASLARRHRLLLLPTASVISAVLAFVFALLV